MRWMPSAVACRRLTMMNLWIETLLDWIYPRQCLMCGRHLTVEERHICLSCLMDLPRTTFHLHPENFMEERFRGLFPLERTAALFLYEKGAAVCNIIYSLKYHDQPDIGVFFGRLLAWDILDSGFFEGIDCIIPVPLAPGRLRERGYNQAAMIARGVSSKTGIPVLETHLVRTRENPTQTRQSVRGRFENAERLFEVRHPEELAGKHVLLVDDVVTTGATIRACADALMTCPDIRFSVLSLGCTY